MKLSEEKMQYLENIRQQLCKGTLSHEDAERFMLDAIEKEVEKESADYDWIRSLLSVPRGKYSHDRYAR